MGDDRKPWAWTIEVDGRAVARGEGLDPTAVRELDRVVEVGTGPDLDAWWRSIAAGPPPDADHAFVRDMILRPTTRAPGLYEDEDGPSMVAAVPEGQPAPTGAYRILWVPKGQGRALALPGDLVFEGAYPIGCRLLPSDDGVVEVTDVEVDVQAPPKP